MTISPATYEAQVASHYESLGYRTSVTNYSNDYGLDVLAENGSERLAIQVKLYGHTSRQVNRQMMMELHGVKDYFDCTRAVLVTDGVTRVDAREVAAKLGIEILELPAHDVARSSEPSLNSPHLRAPPGEGNWMGPSLTFDQLWINHVMPLAGTTISGRGERSNHIVSVDWSGVERITSIGRMGKIDIEIFRLAINHVLRHGVITRDEVNQNYAKRASSGVMLVLSQIPVFELHNRPLRLTLRSGAQNA